MTNAQCPMCGHKFSPRRSAPERTTKAVAFELARAVRLVTAWAGRARQRSVVVKPQTGALLLAASAGKAGIWVVVPCGHHIEQACKVGAADLLQAVKLDSTSSWKSAAGSDELIIGSARLTTSVADSSFVQSVDFDETTTYSHLDVVAMHTALDFVLPSVGPSDRSYGVDGIRFERDGMVATDGYRLHRAPCPGLVPLPPERLLSRRDAVEWLHLCACEGVRGAVLALMREDYRLAVSLPGGVVGSLTGQLLVGAFPDYPQILARVPSGLRVSVNGTELRARLTAALNCARDSTHTVSLRFDLLTGTLTLTVRQEGRDFDATLPCRVLNVPNGEGHAFPSTDAYMPSDCCAVNAKYLRDALGLTERGGVVTLHFSTNPLDPIRITPAHDTELCNDRPWAAVMPLRVERPPRQTKNEE